MSTWQLRVGAVQMRSTSDLSANLARCGELTAQAASEGAQLVVLPECFSFLGQREGDKLAIAEPFDAAGPAGPVMSTLRDLAAKHGVWIVGGGTPELVPGDQKRAYNTALAIAPSGELVARYRKIHLFDVDIPGGAVLRESDSTAPGDELVVIDVAGAPVGVSICYDVRFPELYRQLVKDMGRRGAARPRGVHRAYRRRALAHPPARPRGSRIKRGSSRLRSGAATTKSARATATR